MFTISIAATQTLVFCLLVRDYILARKRKSFNGKQKQIILPYETNYEREKEIVLMEDTKNLFSKTGCF